MGRVWSLVGFQLFFGKQRILTGHPSFTWQEIECNLLYQEFCRSHFQWMRIKSFYDGDQDQSNRSVVERVEHLLLNR